MACYYPIDAYRNKDGNLVFNRREHAQDTVPLQLPCGRCIGCRLDSSRQWATRCVHEASLHRDNCFITLTYAPHHLPPTGSLEKRDYRLFLKNLRKKIAPTRIRYMLCGEYGEDQQGIQNPFTGKVQLGRPHFHLVVFGWRPTDLELKEERDTKGEPYPVYTSQTVSDAWKKGFIEVGEFGFKQARYVASYTMKKRGGEKYKDHYMKINPETGEIHEVIPEFGAQSRMPGIGYGWFKQYARDCEKGYLTIEGKKYPIPAYYLRLMEETNPQKADEIRLQNMLESDPYHRDQHIDRLRVREKVHNKRAQSAQERK